MGKVKIMWRTSVTEDYSATFDVDDILANEKLAEDLTASQEERLRAGDLSVFSEIDMYGPWDSFLAGAEEDEHLDSSSVDDREVHGAEETGLNG